MPKLKVRGNLMMIGFHSITDDDENMLRGEGLAFESSNPCTWCTEEADYEEGFESTIQVFLDDELVMTIDPPSDGLRTSYNGLDSIICENPTWGSEYVLEIEDDFSPNKIVVEWRKYTFGPELMYVLGEVPYADGDLEFDGGGSGTCNNYYVNGEGKLYETEIDYDDESFGMIIKLSE
jgi:hypothetical protein